MLTGCLVVLFCCFTLCLGQNVSIGSCEDQQCLKILLTVTSQVKRKIYTYHIETVYNQDTGHDFRLVDPLLLTVNLYPVKQIYPLKLLKFCGVLWYSVVFCGKKTHPIGNAYSFTAALMRLNTFVNNKPNEVFYHKDNLQNYSKCNEQTIRQLCPENRGFCCACNGEKENSPYHIRGGQDCSTNNTSTHCLQFDPLWYSMNAMRNSSLHYVLGIKLTNSRNKEIASIRIETGQSLYKKQQLSVFHKLTTSSYTNAFKSDEKYLLIPVSNGPVKQTMMVLDKSLFGEECDKIGVAPHSFLQQPNRCQKFSQSCLDNQPMEFWLDDSGKRLQDKPRQYILQDMIQAVPKILREENRWSLVVPLSDIQIQLSINISTDTLRIISKKKSNISATWGTQIFEGPTKIVREIVYIDRNKTKTLSFMLYNSGFTPEAVKLEVRECTVTLNGQLNQETTLFPQITQHLNITFTTDIQTGAFTCKASIKGQHKEESWQLDLQRDHTCVCYPEYNCNCGTKGYYREVIITEGIFHGPLDPNFILTTLLFVLILTGLVKAFLSLWWPVSIGEAGLCLFTNSKVLTHYHEKSLAQYDVIYNERGVPVHPITKEPVQLLPTSEILLINLGFGFYICIIGLHWLLLKLTGLEMKYKYLREEKSWYQKLLSPVSGYSTATVQSHEFNESDKLLAYEQFRKQKTELKYVMDAVYKIRHMVAIMRTVVSFKRNKNCLAKSASVEAFIRQSAENKEQRNAKVKSLTKKLPLQELLKLEIVFFNFQRESTVLKNSGNCYSLCGTLKRMGRKYQFSLGTYNVQMCENIDGVARKLDQPLQIVHPLHYTTELNSSAVHQYITTEPLFPCLNTYLTYSKK